MLSALGAMLVVLSASLAGYIMSRRSGDRLRLILELDKSLIMLRSEIDYSANTLEEAFVRIAGKSSGAAARMFADCAEGIKAEGSSVSDVWDCSVLKTFGGCGFSETDMNTVRGFGRDLGAMDPRSQRDGIGALRSYLAARQTELAEEMKKDKKVYMTVGLSVGMMAAIVLL